MTKNTRITLLTDEDLDAVADRIGKLLGPVLARACGADGGTLTPRLAAIRKGVRRATLEAALADGSLPATTRMGRGAKLVRHIRLSDLYAWNPPAGKRSLP